MPYTFEELKTVPIYKDFVTKYLKGFSSLIKSNNDIINKIIKVPDILIGIKKNNKKIMIFGNGRSAAIASHG